MWIGGSSDAAVRRTARYGTGWQGGGETMEDAIRVVAAIKKALPRGRPQHRPGPLRASFPFYFGAPDATVTKAMDAYASAPAAILQAIRGRRRRHDPRQDRTICCWRCREIHPAPGRQAARQVIAQTKLLIEKVLAADRRRAGRRPRRRRRENAMHIGVAMFFYRLLDDSTGAGGRRRAARLRLRMVARAQPHSNQPQVGLPVGRRAAQEVLRRHGPLRGADGRRPPRRRRSRSAPASAWWPSAIRSRPRSCGLDRPALERPLLFGIGNGWNRDEMENHGTKFETATSSRASASRR